MQEVHRRKGRFGTIRVVERRKDGALLYCVGSSIQTMTARDGTSLFGYIHATKLLLAGAKDVLILGGGGGSLATMLARRGVAVTVVDIDPAAQAIARRYFSLDDRVDWITRDARDYLATCGRTFDGLVLDTCDENGLIEAFATPESLLDCLKILRSSGSMILNLTTASGPPHSAWQLACTMVAEGFKATLFRPALGEEANELLLIRPKARRATLAIDDLEHRPEETHLYLKSLCAFAPRAAGPMGLPRRSAF